MISPTLALCALLAPQELQDDFQFGGPWTFRETTPEKSPETGEPRFGPALEVLDPTDGGVLARSSKGAWLGSPILGPDLDGDGQRELFVVVGDRLTCGADLRSSSIRALSLDGPRELGRMQAWVHFRPEYDAATGWILRGERENRAATLELRADLRGDAAWRMGEEESPIGNPTVARFVGDLDGDGRREVAVGNAWAERPGGDDERPWVGAVAVLGAADGRTLWRALGEQHGEGFGRDIAPAGDLDGDGVDDVAVLASTIDGSVKPARVVVLSGRDGGELADVPIEREARCWSLIPVGDLDGDGALELFLPGSTSDAFVLGSRLRAPLDVSGGWKLAWAASIGDLDADGHDDLVLGRIERVTGEKRVSVYSRAGLRDVPEVALDALPWKGARVTLARLSPERAWDLVAIRRGAALVGGDELVVTPGPRTR